MAREIKDYIARDVSRCNDYKCLIAHFCARCRQLAVDRAKGETRAAVTNFDHGTKVGMCEWFLNVDG
jgi:hypothetical protein